MPLEKFNGLELPAAADMHVHLRDGAMMETVVPTIRQGGVNTVMVMPNLIPPITTVEAALSYRTSLQRLEPHVNYLMSLYLHSSITPSTIAAASAAGIRNVKVYPAGVTTNSSSGVTSLEPFYPVLAAMQEHDMILNLHGEVPPRPTRPPPSGSTSPPNRQQEGEGEEEEDITVLNAEQAFLPTLTTLHSTFPDLRIILEHCSTAASIKTILSLSGPSTVAGTITPHHLFLTIDDVLSNPHNLCKPVAKLPSDRRALLRAVVSGDPRFFLGSDSAPHPVEAKTVMGGKGGGKGGGRVAAGVFTQPYVVGLVLEALEKAVEEGVLREEDVTGEKLEGFLGGYGRRFYGIEEDADGERIVLRRKGERMMSVLRGGEGDSTVEVIPFRSGEKVWSVEWK